MPDTRRRRVPSLAPDDRRAALVDATVPLLRAHGPDVSTRQIAQAAGVAEGTIFGVFPDKNSLLAAALVRALDPQPTVDALAAVDPALDLRERLVRAADLVVARFAEAAPLMPAVRRLAHHGHELADLHERMAGARERLLATLTAVVEPDRHRLRRSPATTARLLLMLCGANAYGPYGDPAHAGGAELVSLLLDGLLVHDGREGGTC